MNTLMSIIVFWLSVNFGLPANYEHPRIAFVPQADIGRLYYRGFETWRAQAAPGARTVVSVYDSRARTIYLREDWKGVTPAELSVLVHEMVHHLQHVAGLRYACPQEREKIAYAAQERWLNLFGGSLERDFETDRFTLLATTTCAH